MAGIILLIPAIAVAQGEHSRRVATELIVMSGDMKRLGSTKTATPQYKGLRDRIRGGLAGLELMARYANEEQERPVSLHAELIQNLHKAFQDNDHQHFIETLVRLINAYPFAATGILPAQATPARLKRGGTLHEEHCAACHDEPNSDVERPAYNLSSEAKQLPAIEFAARMVVGVRGDRLTGIDNPLTDEQVASLIVFYKSR